MAARLPQHARCVRIVHATPGDHLVRPHERQPDLKPEPQPRHVLIPLDGSPLAEQVLPLATALGGLTGAEYTLLREQSFDTVLTYSFYASYNNDLPKFNLVSHLVDLTTTMRGTVFELRLPQKVQNRER